MRRKRLSLHSTVALCLVGMGVLSLALTLASAAMYRDLAYETEASSLRATIGERAERRLDELARDQHVLALRLAHAPALSAGWRRRDTPGLEALLAGALADARNAHDPLALQSLRILDADGARVAAAGDLLDPACDGDRERLRAASPLRPARALCTAGAMASQSIAVPLPAAASPGFIEVWADPVPRLSRLQVDGHLAVRVLRPGGMPAFQSDQWAAMRELPHARASYRVRPTESGASALVVEAMADIRSLAKRLADTRDMIALGAAALVACAMLLILVALRRTLRPLHALQAAAERIASEDPGRIHAFEPVPADGPPEIATPIRSFNHMVRRTAGLLCELEEEIRHRTEAELAATAARELAERHARRASQEKEFSQTTLRSVVDAVIVTGPTGHIEYVNPVAAELMGVTESGASGRELDEALALYERHRDVRVTGIARHAVEAGRTRGRGEVVRLVDARGRRLFVEYAAAAMQGSAGEAIGAVIVFHDVTQAQLLTERLSYQASHDPLTGLINRYELELRLERTVRQVREAGEPGVLCYLDLDQFKLVNDTCGHVAGDALLRQLAAMLTDRLGERGMLARLGGDEFGVLLHPASLSAAQSIAEDLRASIGGFRFAWGRSVFSIGVSIGLVEIGPDASGPELILSAADTACYMAKDNGRNRVQVYQAGDAALIQRRAEMNWVSEINRALEQDRFQLFCQDIVPAHGDRVARHFEILLRLVGSDGRIWGPGAFLPAAERYNLAPAIDRWVLRHAFAWLAATDLPAGALFALNLSGRTLADQDFLGFVTSEAGAAGIDPTTVCFEITETAAIGNLGPARAFMQALRAEGFRFSLDDFGSGLSSFSYLKNLPVDYLKIDGAFVRDIDVDSVHRAMVRSMNDVGHAMQMRTIAEFAETPAICSCLEEIGVDLLQGFRYSRPRPLAEMNPASAPP